MGTPDLKSHSYALGAVIAITLGVLAASGAHWRSDVPHHAAPKQALSGELHASWQQEMNLTLAAKGPGKGLTVILLGAREGQKQPPSPYAYGFDVKNGRAMVTCYVHRGHEDVPICLLTQ